MTDDGIGRLLVASLHQSIGDVLPQRLEYYEHWLSPMGLREGRSGLAPLTAVSSFLRQEGEAPYTQVMRTAGRYSAEWHDAQRRGDAARLWPRGIRRRLALRRARAVIVAAYAPHRVTTAVRRGAGSVVVQGSVFCTLRDRWPWPTCAYFAGAVDRQLALRGMAAGVGIAECRAQGAGQCSLSIDFEVVPPEEP